jgi:hypothetical protein
MVTRAYKRKVTVDLALTQALLPWNGKQGPVLGLPACTGDSANARHLGFPGRLDELFYVLIDATPSSGVGFPKAFSDFLDQPALHRG